MSGTVVIKKQVSKRFLMGMVAVVLVAAGGIFYYGTQQEKSGLEFEENASMGALPGVDLEQRRLDMQAQLDDSMIAFSVNTSPVLTSGTEEGNFMLENPEHNAKYIVAEIYLTKTNELIYKSKAIKPGSYVESIKLDKVLPKGVHSATVYFKGYSLDEQQYIGQTGASVSITVQS